MSKTNVWFGLGQFYLTTKTVIVYIIVISCNARYCSHRRYWLLTTKNELANNSCLGSTTNCSSGSTGRMSFSGRSFFSNMSFGKRKPFMNIRLVHRVMFILIFAVFDFRCDPRWSQFSGVQWCGQHDVYLHRKLWANLIK